MGLELSDGRYYVEWCENGVRTRKPAGTTAVETLEVHRKRRHAVEAGASEWLPAFLYLTPQVRPTGRSAV